MKRRVTIFVAAVANEWIYCCCSFGKHTRERLPSSHSFLYSPTLHSRSSGLSLDMARWMSRWFVVWDGTAAHVRQRPAALYMLIIINVKSARVAFVGSRSLAPKLLQPGREWEIARVCVHTFYSSLLSLAHSSQNSRHRISSPSSLMMKTKKKYIKINKKNVCIIPIYKEMVGPRSVGSYISDPGPSAVALGPARHFHIGRRRLSCRVPLHQLPLTAAAATSHLQLFFFYT